VRQACQDLDERPGHPAPADLVRVWLSSARMADPRRHAHSVCRRRLVLPGPVRGHRERIQLCPLPCQLFRLPTRWHTPGALRLGYWATAGIGVAAWVVLPLLG
jgi:hypothetical protein